ncbi:hypothetical protein M3Y94_00971100 [Aphelenchoides besseyi]|nr:hypothetical protein M3Y94_00971100 [Aphelenchoides besseyi]KAI6224617.1 Heat shock protein [Aphelenchoides besseyi]
MVTIAIDFGTTLTRIAAINCSKHCAVPDEHGNTSIPSVVGFSEKGLVFGTSALKQMESNSANTIIHLSRLLDFDSNNVTNHQTRRHWSHSLNKMENRAIGIPVRNCGHDYVFAPQEIIAMFMTYVKQLVNKVFVDEKVERIVLIVSSCYNTAKRRMIKEAAEAAGIRIRRFIGSQMAVAMRFVDMDSTKSMKNILLLSVNGGTSEASILCVHYGHVNGHEVEIKSTVGNDRLGGIDFTNALIDHYADEIKKTLRIKLSVKTLLGLRRECEKAKRDLSTKPTTKIKLNKRHDGINFLSELSLQQFEQICATLFNQINELVVKTLEFARMDKVEIQFQWLGGGASKMPKIVEMMRLYRRPSIPMIKQGKMMLAKSKSLFNWDMYYASMYGPIVAFFGYRVLETEQVMELNIVEPCTQIDGQLELRFAAKSDAYETFDKNKLLIEEFGYGHRTTYAITNETLKLVSIDSVSLIFRFDSCGLPVISLRSSDSQFQSTTYEPQSTNKKTAVEMKETLESTNIAELKTTNQPAEESVSSNNEDLLQTSEIDVETNSVVNV